MHALRMAIRALRATPVVSLVVIATLGLGIGANTAIFTVVNSLLLRALPVPAPDRLVTVSSDYALAHGFKAGAGWNYQMWTRLQTDAAAFRRRAPVVAADLQLRAERREGAGPRTARERELLQHARRSSHASAVS